MGMNKKPDRCCNTDRIVHNVACVATPILAALARNGGH